MADPGLKKMVFASLCAALTAAGAFVAIPIGPVPIVLQNFFVLLTGLILGSRWGLASVGVYLTAGALGLPVFAGAGGGIGRLMGPTGGYLIGYLPAVFLVGEVSEKTGHHPAGDILAGILGSVIVYAFGVSWLSFITRMGVEKALFVGCFPFIIGDAVKIVAAAATARVLRPIVASTFSPAPRHRSSATP
jgi:biotin transport system substrate-specific component